MPLPVRFPRLHSRGPHHPAERAAAAAVAGRWLWLACRTEAVRRTGSFRASGGNRWAPRGAPGIVVLLPDAYRVVRFCRAADRDPRAQVDACFDVLGMLRPPTLRQIAADQFSRRRGWEAALANAAGQARAAREALPARGSGETSPIVERVKSHYAQDREVCRALIGETLGYHPRSEHCVGCPVADGCREDVARFFGPDALRQRGVG